MKEVEERERFSSLSSWKRAYERGEERVGIGNDCGRMEKRRRRGEYGGSGRVRGDRMEKRETEGNANHWQQERDSQVSPRLVR